MKNLFLIMSLFLAIATIKSQNHFGSHKYPHSDSRCTCGSLGINAPGFLIAGVTDIVAQGNQNFYIHRTDSGGVFNGSAQEFQREYKINGNSSCGTSPSQILSCYDVKVSERSLTGGYAVAGVTSIGVFYLNLSSTGAVSNQRLYLFPANVNSPDEVLLTESFAFANQFYIVGSFDGIIYMLRVGAGGLINASHDVDITSTFSLHPHGIIESPYGSQDLMIVGTAYDGTDSYGFTMQIDNTLSTPILAYTHFHVNAPTICGFSSIALANSQSLMGQPGFVIGGYANTNSVTGNSWMVKMDQSQIVWWSTVIQGTSDSQSRMVKGVVERLNTASQYEYYGVASSTIGMMVYKLDDAGTPVSVSASLQDEFVYNSGSGGISFPVGLSYKNNISAYDDGLHIYGTLDAVTQTDYYIVQSYFSGESGCDLVQQITDYTNVSPSINLFTWSQAANHLTDCANFSVNTANINSYAAVCGPFRSLSAPATNNRPAPVTLKENMAVRVDISPNPNTGLLRVNFGGKRFENITVSLIDVLGKQIRLTQLNAFGEDEAEFDLSRLNLTAGVYQVVILTQNETFTERIAYVRE